MKSRREFIKHTLMTVAEAAITQKIASMERATTFNQYNCNANFVLDSRCKSVMSSSLGYNNLDRQLKLQWQSISGPSTWAGDNIQMHSRYTPFQQGASLDMPALGRAVQKNTPKNKSLALLQNALVTGVRPYGMLINMEKVQRKGIDELSLYGFVRQSVKPTFTINSSGYAAENSWLAPMVKSAGLFIDECLHEDKHERDVTRLNALLKTHLSNIEIDVAFGLSGAGQYADLIDAEAVDRVAIYGDPILLQQSLQVVHHGHHFSSKYQVITLQDFMKVDTPSFFTSQMLQVGNAAAGSKGVDKVLEDFTKVMTEVDAFELVVPQSINTEERKHLQVAWSSLQVTHDADAYAHTPGIDYVTDGGLLSRFGVDLQGGLQLYDATSADYLRNTAANAIWRSRRRWLLRQKIMSGHIAQSA